MNSVSDYSEASADIRLEGQELSHLSIEAGHFFMEDFGSNDDRIKVQLRQVVPQIAAYTAAAQAEFGPAARVSTCFLIDDYFRHDTDPTVILDELLTAAAECGVRIDYLAREAGCAQVPVFVNGEPTARPIELASMMAARVVPEPEQNATGRRPSTMESGWLSNGTRSSEFAVAQAMRVAQYCPPEEFGARNHSIFLDVQLWRRWTERGDGGQVERTQWSCPFLTSIWQLLRLGMIRDRGAVVAQPAEWTGTWPNDWKKMPAVVKLNSEAEPFAAYRAVSILPHTYLSIEHAVRLILDHLQIDEAVYQQVLDRGRVEEFPISVPRAATHRLSHVFVSAVGTT
ncbi:hypothetical protein GFY24_02680 [Nocardia sp. SYP-A9097]|uniref:SCO2522 family protein n=1 Tax=Nocardia sp. SYP-A9097 TaxID=2663237 RepID=UPI00132A3F8C|nr:SCO2522 family protein [Nocardia sp. SYP-A9097]MRH86383.1 hypothetical protein [Nocardia sp. SYP-A9097]